MNRVSWNLKEDLFKAIREGKPEKAFDLWANTVGFHYFVQKCGLFLWTEYFPHKIGIWSWAIPDSDFTAIGTNRTLDGRTIPILKRSWGSPRQILDMKLDWLSCKLTTHVIGTDIILQEQILDLEANQYV